MRNITVIIPTLNPCEKIFGVVSDALNAGFEKIIIVNDGSSQNCKPIFDRLENEFNCTVLTHEVNRGKGAALKTAFSYFDEHLSSCIGAVTLDDDGQHTIKDTVRVCEKLKENPDNLVLGVRDFNLPQVPKKSRMGNKITAKFMKLLCSVDVSDTQTGLRAIPASHIKDFINVKGDRFEYETNMLLVTHTYGINISEVTIETVYHDNNSATHFHPLRDSFRIYKLLFKHAFLSRELLSFAASSLSAVVIDYIAYWLFINLLPTSNKQLLATVSFYPARLISSIYNYLINKLIVFKKKSGGVGTLLKYYALCIIQVSISSIVVGMLLSRIAGGNMLLVWKFIVECIIFIFSFTIQRKWVFNNQ